MHTIPTTRAGLVAAYRHCCDHGFCTICGGVWPCARAGRDPVPQAVPVPRLATVSSIL